MEFSNELFKCRLCLCGSENFVHIFNVNVETSYILADLISDLLKFEVSRVDGYPQFVCSECCNKLTEFQIFKEHCITCKETYDCGNLEPETILGDTNILETNHHPIKLEEELDAQYIAVNRQMPVSEEITSEIFVKKECMDDERDAHSEICLSPVKLEFKEEYVYPNAEILAVTRQTSRVSESGSRTSTLMPTCSNSNSYGNKSPFNFFPQEKPSYERVSVKLENSARSNPFEGRLEEGLVGDGNREDSSEEAFDATFGAREENRSSAEMPSVRMAGTRKMNIGEQRRNKKRKAAEERDKDDSRKVYKCVTCGKEFLSGWNLDQHTKIHGTEKPFMCSLCGKRFLLKHHLAYHQKTHENKDFKCTECGEKFVTKTHLMNHLVEHSRRKQESHAHSEERFDGNYDPEGCQSMDDGERALECKVCGRGFGKWKDFLEHREYHMGEDMLCTICGRKWSKRSDFMKHVMTHMGVKPYECGVCRKRFLKVFSLNRHMKLHAGEGVFSCNLCGMGYAEKRNLVKHMSAHGRIE